MNSRKRNPVVFDLEKIDQYFSTQRVPDSSEELGAPQGKETRLPFLSTGIPDELIKNPNGYIRLYRGNGQGDAPLPEQKWPLNKAAY